MSRLAAKQAFERAVVVRDQLESLTWLSRRLAGLRDSEDVLNGVYELPGHRRRIWLWLDKGAVIGSCPRQKQPPENLLQKFNAEKRLKTLSDNMSNVYLKAILMSWFRNHPDETTKLFQPGELVQRKQAA